MNLTKATYKHDHKAIAELLDSGETFGAEEFCNVVLFSSKSKKLQAKNLELVHRMIELGADPNAVPFDGHAPPIDLACGSPNAGTVKALLDAGAKPLPDSAPHCAIAEDWDENLQVLIDYGIQLDVPMKNVDPSDDFTPTPLEYAKELKSRKCLRLLQKHFE